MTPCQTISGELRKDLEKQGLFYYPEAIGLDQEQRLLIETDRWFRHQPSQPLRTRATLHFGHTFVPEKLTVDSAIETPVVPKLIEETVRLVLERHHPALADWNFDQVTVNRYRPGGGIARHVDTHSCFCEPIAILSLESPTVIQFSHQRTSFGLDLWLPNRSLLVMTGPSRYQWCHKIACRRTDLDHEKRVLHRGARTSITVRQVRLVPVCDCSYPESCDTQNPSSLVLPDRLALPDFA
jgi:alkylated DNA repair protein alkB family protein 8